MITGQTRKGYFIQQPRIDDQVSSALFVFSPRHQLQAGQLAKLSGTVTPYQAREGDKVCLQFKPKHAQLQGSAPLPEAIELDLNLLASSHLLEVQQYLNSLESMRVKIPAGLVCVAPANLFGDYVVAPPSWPGFCRPPGGVLIQPEDPHRWIPSFRVLNQSGLPDVYVGDELRSAVTGPLNYRASAYQVTATQAVEFAAGQRHEPTKLSWPDDRQGITVMTLNTFNLDPKVERKSMVKDPRMDVDDDVGERQYRNLALAITEAGACPDVVALQEIQDDDGSEQTDQVQASGNLELLCAVIENLSGVAYEWIDSPPELHAEGGQPGGNIRNAFLYRPDRIRHSGPVIRLGESAAAYEDSRRPVSTTFEAVAHTQSLEVINVHLASKRHQHSKFAATDPTFDPREPQRIEQCKVISETLKQLNKRNQDYYVTGDFNDYEFSASMLALEDDHSVNLLNELPPEQRYDYNHRGQLLALMHGVISKRQHARSGNAYQILHGNELEPVDPDSTSSDHAYVIARLVG